MANATITPQTNEIHQIKPKGGNTQYYLKDDAARTALSNIQISLDNNYTSTDEVLGLSSPAAGDSFQTAISKLHAGLVSDELILQSGLNNLDARVDKKLTDYSKEYLTLVSLEDDNTIYWKGVVMDTSFEKTISVSTDNGTTWTEYTSSSSTILATLNTGDKLLVKGNNDAYGRPGSQSGPPGAVKFESTKTYNVEGNIMSLIYGDNFIGKNTLTTGCTFYYLFGDQDKSYKVVNAKNLILPATTLATYCYANMFQNCTSLTIAPTLPATTLATYCYSYMFYGCTSLTTAPQLPATTLANYCYESMFHNCTSLTTAPELPATTLAQSCYAYMFQGCSSLTTAPELPATTLVNQCYYQMFRDCTSLNHIKCLATNISATYCTNNWVQNVAATGTFVKNASMTSWTTGNNGVPTGWNTYTKSEYEVVRHYELSSELNKYKLEKDYSKQYLTFEALQDGTFQFTNAINYSIDEGTTWVALAADTATPNITSGNKIMWKATLTPSSSSPYGIGTFSSTGNFNVEGNALSLLFGDNFIGQTDLTSKNRALQNLFSSCSKLLSAKNLSLHATTLADYCYVGMFNSCTNLTTAPQLPATTLAQACYASMFGSCTSLTTAPQLPAMTLAQACYQFMLYNCTSLTTAPELPATTLANTCYNNMFNGCTNLTTAPQLPATTLEQGCYQQMFNGCTNLTTAPQLPATTLTSGCYSYMFSGCTSLTTAPELPATTLAQDCYASMFGGCTSLNYIKAMFTTTPSTGYTTNWVKNVAASGTFVKNSAAEWDVTGVNGIPTDWTVKNASDIEVVLKEDLKLDSNYTESSLQNAALTIVAGDSIQTAISKIHKALLDDEYVTATALTDLNDKIGDIEYLLSQI